MNRVSEYIIGDFFLPDEVIKHAVENDVIRELVRCKDCKNRNSWKCWMYFFGRMNLPDDYYCADGKRQEGDKHG